jgi:hypothetical protein
MADTPDNDDARAALVATLLQKIAEDRYPSTTMLNLVEQLLTEEEQPAYVQFLQQRLRDDRFPSIPMLDRLVKLVK